MNMIDLCVMVIYFSFYRSQMFFMVIALVTKHWQPRTCDELNNVYFNTVNAFKKLYEMTKNTIFNIFLIKILIENIISHKMCCIELWFYYTQIVIKHWRDSNIVYQVLFTT